MKPLYTTSEFQVAKSKDKLPCQCYECDNIFYVWHNLFFKGVDYLR